MQMPQRVDVRVGEDGYGVLIFGGMRLAVMPFHRTPVADLAKVTEGELSVLSPAERPVLVTQEAVDIATKRRPRG